MAAQHSRQVCLVLPALQPAHGKKELQSCYSGSGSWKRPYSLGVRHDRKIVSSYLLSILGPSSPGSHARQRITLAAQEQYTRSPRLCQWDNDPYLPSQRPIFLWEFWCVFSISWGQAIRATTPGSMGATSTVDISPNLLIRYAYSTLDVNNRLRTLSARRWPGRQGCQWRRKHEGG